MKKGFTLLELLVTIGILAILTTAVALVINPVELLRQARDSQRVADLDTLKSTIGLYLARAGLLVDLDGPLHLGVPTGCTQSWWWSQAGAAAGPGLQPFRSPNPNSIASLVVANPRAVDGSGWVPINLADPNVFPASPITKLPVDPNPDTTRPMAPQTLSTDPTGRYYAYSCSNTNKTFEINASMESARYSYGGPKDLESTDGGLIACSSTGNIAARCSNVDGGTIPKADFVYEIGNDPGLDL